MFDDILHHNDYPENNIHFPWKGGIIDRLASQLQKY